MTQHTPEPAIVADPIAKPLAWPASLPSAVPQQGYSICQSWASGNSWRLGSTYIVAEQSPAMSSREHERTLPGLNHLAFHAGSQEDLDVFVEESRRHGWVQLFEDKYPHAGGPDHYAAYLVNTDGFEIELVATA